MSWMKSGVKGGGGAHTSLVKVREVLAVLSCCRRRTFDGGDLPGTCIFARYDSSRVLEKCKALSRAFTVHIL